MMYDDDDGDGDDMGNPSITMVGWFILWKIHL